MIGYNRIENFQDDAMEIEGSQHIGRIEAFGNYIGNVLTCFAPGQMSVDIVGPILFYRNICALFRDPFISRGASSMVDWNFQGGARYGHEYVFKQNAPNVFYYYNTVALSKSGDAASQKGVNWVHNGATTYYINSILMKINNEVGEDSYGVGGGRVINSSLYWKMNDTESPADTLLGGQNTTAGLCTAQSWECNGVGDVAHTGSDPNFADGTSDPNRPRGVEGFGFGLVLDKSDGNKWEVDPVTEFWDAELFLLDDNSIARGRAQTIPSHPAFGTLPDVHPIDPTKPSPSSQGNRDLGAIPYGEDPNQWNRFPFNEGWRGPWVENERPNGIIDQPTGNVSVNEGLSVYFCGSRTDGDGRPAFTYVWDFGADPHCPADSNKLCPGNVSFNQDGTCLVTFTVTDRGGMTDLSPATRTITVNPVGGGGGGGGGCADCSRCICVEGAGPAGGGGDCGNNVVEGFEVCDGTDLGGQSCQGLGFEGGALTCNATCTEFDTSGCES